MNRILTTYSSGKKEWLYKATCSSCNSDRGYVKLIRLSNICRTCSGKKVSASNVGKIGPNTGKKFSQKTKELMSRAKNNYVPWNKGKKETRPEVKLKQALARVGKIPWNKGTANLLATDAVKRKVRHLVRRYIKGAPSTIWLENVICLSQDRLKVHIESKFQTGMTWDNWTLRGWHLDHIKPLSSFNLNDPEELKKACHYSNLQPLWARDNLKKAAS